MARTYKEWKDSEVRSKVYNALAQISHEFDASEEEMDRAIEWFQTHFYEDEYEGEE